MSQEGIWRWGREAGGKDSPVTLSCHLLVWEQQTIMVSKGKPHPATFYATLFSSMSLAQNTVGFDGMPWGDNANLLNHPGSSALLSIDPGQRDHVEMQFWL